MHTWRDNIKCVIKKRKGEERLTKKKRKKKTEKNRKKEIGCSGECSYIFFIDIGLENYTLWWFGMATVMWMVLAIYIPETILRDRWGDRSHRKVGSLRIFSWDTIRTGKKIVIAHTHIYSMPNVYTLYYSSKCADERESHSVFFLYSIFSWLTSELGPDWHASGEWAIQPDVGTSFHIYKCT